MAKVQAKAHDIFNVYVDPTVPGSEFSTKVLSLVLNAKTVKPDGSLTWKKMRLAINHEVAEEMAYFCGEFHRAVERRQKIDAEEKAAKTPKKAAKKKKAATT